MSVACVGMRTTTSGRSLVVAQMVVEKARPMSNLANRAGSSRRWVAMG